MIRIALCLTLFLGACAAAPQTAQTPENCPAFEKNMSAVEAALARQR